MTRYERRAAQMPQQLRVHATPGLIVEDVQTGFVGEILRIERVAGQWTMLLEGRGDIRRRFPLGPGWWIDGKPVELIEPAKAATPKASGPQLTASGSIRPTAKARTALPSRIWVEGKHDWQLIDKVWGEDLRAEGIAVEELSGVDNLEAMIDTFKPGPGRRAGVLVDHLVPGSKESRIVEDVLARRGNGHVFVLGHPYVDVWQAIKPTRVGLQRWPEIPRGTDIKVGTLAALRLPHATQEDIGLGWQKILGTVRTWKDLEPALLGRVEELIDFVTIDADSA